MRTSSTGSWPGLDLVADSVADLVSVWDSLLVLLVLLSAIQANIPVSLFEIDTLTPGITVFGLSFMTLFSATLIAKDRESASCRGCILLRLRDLTLSWDICSRYYLLLSDRF